MSFPWSCIVERKAPRSAILFILCRQYCFPLAMLSDLWTETGLWDFLLRFTQYVNFWCLFSCPPFLFGFFFFFGLYFTRLSPALAILLLLWIHVCSEHNLPRALRSTPGPQPTAANSPLAERWAGFEPTETLYPQRGFRPQTSCSPGYEQSVVLIIMLTVVIYYIH